MTNSHPTRQRKKEKYIEVYERWEKGMILPEFYIVDKNGIKIIIKEAIYDHEQI